MIGVVVPTIREESYDEFLKAWEPLFTKYKVELITIWDTKPLLVHNNNTFDVQAIMGEDSDLIYNKSDVVRNLGFAYIAKYLPKVEYIVTLDDDTKPVGDTMADHIRALNMRVPVSWMNTYTQYMRGFPYNIRLEAPVMLSHGVWDGVRDWDAPTQLVLGNRPTEAYKGVIPKGVMYPMCGMNIAFKREMLPYMYYAPMGPRVGLDRFGDIWLGIESKKILDDKGWAVVSGYAKVLHDRASNVWKNLQKESVGLEMNENYGQGEYFKLYERQRKRWEKLILSSQQTLPPTTNSPA